MLSINQQLKQGRLTMAEDQEKVTPEELTPLEEFNLFKDRVKTFLNTDLKRFNLKIYPVSDLEFVVYQGSITNVWGRFNTRQKSFYRNMLERQFVLAGLIESSNETVVHRS